MYDAPTLHADLTAPALLCHGCDTPLGPDRYCPNCEEVMPVYAEPAEPFLHGSHPVQALHPRAHEAAPKSRKAA